MTGKTDDIRQGETKKEKKKKKKNPHLELIATGAVVGTVMILLRGDGILGLAMDSSPIIVNGGGLGAMTLSIV